jgi:hypothetical protein
MVAQNVFGNWLISEKIPFHSSLSELDRGFIRVIFGSLTKKNKIVVLSRAHHPQNHNNVRTLNKGFFIANSIMAQPPARDPDMLHTLFKLYARPRIEEGEISLINASLGLAWMPLPIFSRNREAMTWLINVAGASKKRAKTVTPYPHIKKIFLRPIKSLKIPVIDRTIKEKPSTVPSSIPVCKSVVPNTVRIKIGVTAKAITDDRFKKNAPMLRNHSDEGNPKK